MLAIGLTLLGFGKRAWSFAWAIVSRASVWQLATIAACIYMCIQHFELAHARKDAAAYLKQRDEYKRQLDAISTKRNEQQVVTRDRIVTVTRTIKEADRQAQKVETAPLPQTECHGTTPQEVRDADV